MAKTTQRTLDRRAFLKLTGAAAAGAALAPARAGQARAAKKYRLPLESHYSVCDMCFNKCGLIARVRGGVVEKLDPNPKFLKSRGMLCARGNAGIAQNLPDRR